MKEQEKLKATVLKLYNAGSKVSDIVMSRGERGAFTYLSYKYYM